MAQNTTVVPLEKIQESIFFLRGHKIMLDEDLSLLYEVSTKALNQAVRRNLSRFPQDFMFQITTAEYESLRSQFVTLKIGDKRRGTHRKYLPYAFTEQGIAMLSSVLNSERAVHVNIEIIRTFVRLRQLLGNNRELARKVEALEKKYDHQFKVVFDAIRELIAAPPSKQRKIGFHASKTERHQEKE